MSLGNSTAVAYIAMLEMGIALVAVNLPSLWLLCTSVIPEKVTHGLRSIMSLSSLRSSQRARSHRSHSTDSGERNITEKAGSTISGRPSESSHIYNGALEMQAPTTEVYALSGRDTIPEVPENTIAVQKSFQRV